MNKFTQRLTTFLDPTCMTASDGKIAFTVFWRLGVSQKGAVRVNVSDHITDPHVVAELACIQHLLEDRAVAGNMQTGADILLVASQGAIRKLITSTSGKPGLKPWANFLKTRFLGVNCVVQKDTSWLPTLNTHPKCELDVKRPRRSAIQIRGLGSVSVSEHAIERLQMHMNYPRADELWRALANIAHSKTLARLPTSTLKLNRDQIWHGKAGIRLFDPKTQWTLVVVVDKAELVLATVYQRSGSASSRISFPRYSDKKQLSLPL